MVILYLLILFDPDYNNKANYKSYISIVSSIPRIKGYKLTL